jgi:hypothetical protein
MQLRVATNAANHRRGTKRSVVERPSEFALLADFCFKITLLFFPDVIPVFIR